MAYGSRAHDNNLSIDPLGPHIFIQLGEKIFVAYRRGGHLGNGGSEGFCHF